MQQWTDELRKYAPNLEVHTYYATKENKARALRRLRQCDVLVTTPHMIWPEFLLENIEVRRLDRLLITAY